MIQHRWLIIFMILALPLFAQEKSGETNENKPDGEALLVPLPKTAPAPKDNPTTPEKVALGKQLFFDPRLSPTFFREFETEIRGGSNLSMFSSDPTIPDAQHGFPYLSGRRRLVVKDAIVMGAALVTMADSTKSYLRKRASSQKPTKTVSGKHKGLAATM